MRLLACLWRLADGGWLCIWVTPHERGSLARHSVRLRTVFPFGWNCGMISIAFAGGPVRNTKRRTVGFISSILSKSADVPLRIDDPLE